MDKLYWPMNFKYFKFSDNIKLMGGQPSKVPEEICKKNKSSKTPDVEV